MQRRLDNNPQAMRQRRETVEHPFGTLKMRMGATHFLMKRLPRVATEMALHVLAYNLTRVINIVGIQPLMAAMRALSPKTCGRRPLQSHPGWLAPIRSDSRTKKPRNSGKPLHAATAPGAPGVSALAEAFLHNQGPHRTK